MDGKASLLKRGSKDELSEVVEQNAQIEHSEIRRSQAVTVDHAEPNNNHSTEAEIEHDEAISQKDGKVEHAEANNQKDGKVEQAKKPDCDLKDEKAKHADERRKQPSDKTEDIKVEGSESKGQSKNKYFKDAESTIHSKIGRVGVYEPTGRSKAGKVEKAESNQGAKYAPNRKKFNKSKASKDQLKGRFKSFRETVKKFWDVWSRFKTKNTQNPNPSISEKTLGVPGFEEIACIEAEVPDIMMMDKDRVRTSCKECMKDEPAFPTKEQIKAKLIAADKYYGVKTEKSKSEQDTLEHDADYYDTDGSVVRPSWRFILERPLVEQYVLMTNYIRKVSVLSELNDNKASKKFIEEEDSGSDAEYKKFEQKFIREKRELLKPMQKPKTQDMAVQTSFEPKLYSREDVKESVSEISLYPESEESTNSPDASAVTIVTSRDYTSPLQSDFDGRTTDKSANIRGGKWWESHAVCAPSESFQTSHDSINKNTSSGSDGQSVPAHTAWGNTAWQPARDAFSNDSDSRIVPHNRSVEPTTHKKPKDSKKVSFSPVVTYYQGPNMTSALYNVVEGQDVETETKQVEPQQSMETENPEENQQTANQAQDLTLSTEDKITETQPKDRTEEWPTEEEELPGKIETRAVRPKRLNRKVPLENILQDKKRGQIVSVSVPADWHEDRVLRNKKMVNVAVSRSPTGYQPVTKRVSFQEYDEIPDLKYSNPDVTTVKDRNDANIQTQTPVTQKSTGNFYLTKHGESQPSNQALDNRNPRKSQVQAIDDSAHIIKNRNDALNQLGRQWHEEIQSTGTETHIRTALPRLTQLEKTLETMGTADQRFHGHRTKQMILDSASTPDATAQPPSFLNNDVGTHKKSTLWENNLYSQPKMEDTGNSPERNAKEVHKRPSNNQDQKTIPRILPSPPNKQVESRQHSTDTEGPSSSSNEHIKLKASPPCFFKVATPPDLSWISVDEFYPEVPEIDAELPQISENKTASTPHIEIVFASKESALRYIQDAEFHRFSQKEENTMLQKSVKTTQNSPITLNAPNKGKTIVASAGVGIKIAEAIGKPQDNRRDKSGNSTASKAPTEASQQSTITQNLGTSSLIGKSLIESKGENFRPKICQTKLRKTDLGSLAMKQEETQDYEEHKVKLGETRQTAQQLLEDKDIKSRRKVIDVNAEPMATSNMSAAQHRSMQATGLLNKAEETEPPKKPSKSTANERDEIDKENRDIERGEDVEKRETLLHDDEEDEIITIQRQLESASIDPQSIHQGRTKLYMRTLSSLAEETSSVVESTSSTQEKLIDMPTVERPVEELKTIFEKPVSSVSGGSEQAEGSSSEPKKCGQSKEKLDEKFGKLVSNEKIMTTDDDKTTDLSHLGHKSDREFTTSQGHLPPAVFEPKASNAKDSNEAKLGTVQNDKPIKSDNSLGGRDIKNRSEFTEEESSAQLSQIDVIRASEIYSNTSMSFSSSEDRGVKLTKARTGFQPLTLDDDLASSDSCRDTVKSSNDKPGGPDENHLGANERITSKDKVPVMADRNGPVNTDIDSKERGMKLKTNHEGDNSAVSTTQILAGKQNGETEEALQAIEHPSKSPPGTEKVDANQSEPIAQAKSGTDNSGNPSDSKQWLMDVIPALSKNTRYRGFKPHKPICVKEATDAEAVKYRQDAVKPVFRFLKRQREMEENKE